MAYEDPNAPSQPQAPATVAPIAAPATTPKRSPAHGTGCGRPLLRSSSSSFSASSAGWSPLAATTGSSPSWDSGGQLPPPAL